MGSQGSFLESGWFSYQNSVYTIEPGGITANTRFSIWKSKSNADTADCICEYTAPSGMIGEDELINDFLNTKCFNGKSFFEIEDEITVDVSMDKSMIMTITPIAAA